MTPAFIFILIFIFTAIMAVDPRIAMFNTEVGGAYEDVYIQNKGQITFVLQSLALLTQTHLHPSILDVGVGTGRPTSSIAAASGARIWGCDFSSTMVDLARKNVPSGTFEVIANQDYTPPASQPQFDGVFVIFSTQGMQEDVFRAFVAEKLGAWVKQGGYLFFGTFLKDAYPEDADWRERDEGKGNGTVMRKFFGKKRAFLVWSGEAWRELLKTGGFEVVQTQLVPFQPERDCDWEPHYYITAKKV